MADSITENETKKQTTLFFSFLLIGCTIAALAILVDVLFLNRELPRIEALVNFINPILPLVWLFFAWIFLLSGELLGVGVSWFRQMRKNLVEAIVSVWGWFCGVAISVSLASLVLGETQSDQVAEFLIMLSGVTIAFLPIVGLLEKIYRDPSIARSVRWVAFIAGLALLFAYPALVRWNSESVASEPEIQRAGDAQPD